MGDLALTPSVRFDGVDLVVVPVEGPIGYPGWCARKGRPGGLLGVDQHKGDCPRHKHKTSHASQLGSTGEYAFGKHLRLLALGVGAKPCQATSCVIAAAVAIRPSRCSLTPLPYVTLLSIEPKRRAWRITQLLYLLQLSL